MTSKTQLKRLVIQNPIGMAERMHKLEQQLAAEREKVKMLREALKYAIDDLILRAKLTRDNSLAIGQGCLDQMNDALSKTEDKTS